jgi:hypothetical protein
MGVSLDLWFDWAITDSSTFVKATYFLDDTVDGLTWSRTEGDLRGISGGRQKRVVP